MHLVDVCFVPRLFQSILKLLVYIYSVQYTIFQIHNQSLFLVIKSPDMNGYPLCWTYRRRPFQQTINFK